VVTIPDTAYIGVRESAMKVLHIGTNCGLGGVQILLATLIREQRRNGICAEVFFFSDAGGIASFAELCPVHFASCSPLAEVIRIGRFDVVHCITYVADQVSAAIHEAGFKGAVIVTSHQCGEYECSLKSDFVTAVSNAVADGIQSHYVAPVVVVRNGIDTTRFRPTAQPAESGKPIMGWVGRSDDGIKDFAGFLALAHCFHARFRIAVVDGSSIDQEVLNWLPEDCIVFRRKPWDEMPSFYQWIGASSGFLLSTSVSESCGLNLLEAQACGCPVIAPRVGGIPEVLEDSVTGFMYEKEDGVTGVLKAIECLYSDGRYMKVSEAAWIHAAQFSVEAMHNAYLALYIKALSKRRP
jgi:glycosyltransferase involved in cell wall biosynthesis